MKTDSLGRRQRALRRQMQGSMDKGLHPNNQRRPSHH
jgi:hypothetical protein